MSKVHLLISIADQHLSRFSQVIKDTEKAGLDVETKDKDLGLVTGSIDEEKVDSLRKVKGVEHVETERNIQIPPPESDIQ